MEKTALTQLINLMQELEATDNPVYNKAKELIEVEYRQIEDAYNKGVDDGYHYYTDKQTFENAYDYYVHKYGELVNPSPNV